MATKLFWVVVLAGCYDFTIFAGFDAVTPQADRAVDLLTIDHGPPPADRPVDLQTIDLRVMPCTGLPDGAVCAQTSDPCKLPGTCSSGVCGPIANKPDNTACNDGNACTTSDQCQNGTCGGITIVCTALDQCHNAGTCSGGVCSNPNKPNGTACGTNLVCNNGSCVACTAGVSCTPTNPCHNGSTSCATGTSVCVDSGTNKTNGTACNDGNACTTSDQCSSGTCVGTSSTNCDDGNPCTSDGCNPSNGCWHMPLADGTQFDGLYNHRCCGGQPVDIATSNTNCGACGIACDFPYGCTTLWNHYYCACSMNDDCWSGYCYTTGFGAVCAASNGQVNPSCVNVNCPGGAVCVDPSQAEVPNYCSYV